MTNQKKRHSFFILFLCAALSVFFVGCGDDAGSDKDSSGNDGGGGNGGGGNGGGGNVGGGNGNGGGGNGGGQTTATCTTACNVLVGNSCAGVPSQTECEAGCQQNFTAQLITCVSGTTTCADAEACIDTGGNGGGGGGGGGAGEVGSSCDDNDDCKDAFCKTPAGGDQGTCAVNDFGNTCEGTSDCEHGACLVSSGGGDDFGYCSSTCESFTDCPTFWDCGELGNAAGTYCLQD